MRASRGIRGEHDRSAGRPADPQSVTRPLSPAEVEDLRAELRAAGAEPAITNRARARIERQLLAAWRAQRIVDGGDAHDARADRRVEVMRAAWRLSRALGVRAGAPIAVRGGAMEIGPVVYYDGCGEPEVDAVLREAVLAVEAYDAIEGGEAPCTHAPPCSCTVSGAAARVLCEAARLRGEAGQRPALWRARDRAVLALESARAEGDPDRIATAEGALEVASRAMRTRDAWREELDAAVRATDRTLDRRGHRWEAGRCVWCGVARGDELRCSRRTHGSREGHWRLRALAIVEHVTGIPEHRLRDALRRDVTE